MSFYLLEIACEELPAVFVTAAAEYAKDRAAKELNELKLSFDEIRSGTSPRRIYLYISGLPEKQCDYEESFQGPPASAAFNPDGSLSPVGEKFVKAKSLDEYKREATPKGEYLTGIKRFTGADTDKLISAFASRLILSFPSPKAMRWGALSIAFARPIRYILSIFDGKLLPLDIKELTYTDEITAHRFLSPLPIKVTGFDAYKKALADGYVIADISERVKRIKNEIKTLSEKGNYIAEDDESLICEIANLTEYPLAVEGSFNEAFLELPPSVLSVTMKKHQKFFPLYQNGKLLPKFIGFSNMLPVGGDFTLIREGYEKVLAARLSDALFFYRNDRDVSLKEQTAKLRNVVYFEKLGTLYDKTKRVAAIARYLGKTLNIDKQDKIAEAASIAKADLLSEMVFELPELQGIMGKYYALYQGYNEEIAQALEEQYLPRYAGDKLPQGVIGGILALSDRIDTISAAFSVEMIPTGSLDPYGLRRTAIGIINIVENFGWRLSLKEFADFAAAQVNANAEIADEVLGYILSRQKQILSQSGVTGEAYDISAVLRDSLIDIRIRAELIANSKDNANLASVAAAYKRINNILKKSGECSKESSQTDKILFEFEEEDALYNLYISRFPYIAKFIADREWLETLRELETFAEPLNAYFSKVMVMHEVPKIRNNRLSMLSALKKLFNSTGLT
ncbi:MAG: glycine--tRNA ligase subunit beta [Deferribacteraceae bacterium]|jgi:glycyl-tRNA synthetase beta chain|nr:glycine--tRNA ligase subunit beta [Deferribacteraceae bacterium]